MRDILLIAIGGALGSVGRYTVSGAVHRVTGLGFPFGTLAVNVIGCVLLGLVMEVGLATEVIPRGLRVAATIGFLGAFTTYSTFGYETVRLIEDGAWLPAAANVGANVLIGVPAAMAGVWLGRLLTGGA